MSFEERASDCKGQARKCFGSSRKIRAVAGADAFVTLSLKSFKSAIQETELQNELFLPCFPRNLLTKASCVSNLPKS